MDLAAAVQAVQVRSVKAYLRRQQLEAQRQQLVYAIQQSEQELVMLDGEERALLALKEADGE